MRKVDIRQEIKQTKGTECVSFSLFIGALFAILLVSVLANLWIRVINNLAFNNAMSNFRWTKSEFFIGDNFWWSLIIALIVTGIFVGYVFLAFDNDTSNALRTRIVGITGGGGASAAANVSNIEPQSSEIDSNNNGIPDYLENLDVNNNGILDHLENDEIPEMD